MHDHYGAIVPFPQLLILLLKLIMFVLQLKLRSDVL